MSCYILKKTATKQNNEKKKPKPELYFDYLFTRIDLK